MAKLSVASPNWPGTYEASSMNFRSAIPCIALASLLGGAGVFSAPPASASGVFCDNPNYTAPHKVLKPVLDLISKGEGDYNSINRGRAGDTPGGIQSLKGHTFENFTTQQVMDMQRYEGLYAVGRYQFIPSTLRWAVTMSEVDPLDMFTPEVQDKLAVALIMYKRPAVGAYIRGDHELEGWALNEIAKEWASIEYRNGRGYYDHIGGNRAHITRAEMSAVLQQVKTAWQAKG